MRIHLLSDLHLEDEECIETALSLLQPPPSDEFDVIVLAGDIGCRTSALQCLFHLAQWGKPIVYVLGNHEFYGGTLEDGKTYWKQISLPILVHVLDEACWDYQGYRFLGCTLWTNGEKELPFPLRDYEAIENFSQDKATDEWKRQVDWLTITLTTSPLPCIVVTHHLPSIRCIDRVYLFTYQHNRAFYSPLDSLVKLPATRLWCHGHTHRSISITIDGTPVVCNPQGSRNPQGGCENEKFDPCLILNIS